MNVGENVKKEKKQKIALAIILALTLIYAYINYLFIPKLALLQEQRKQLQNRQAAYQQLFSFQSNQAGLAKTSESLEGEAKNLTALIPSQLDKPEIMVDIYTIAKLHAVEPQTLKFEPIQNKGDHQELTMNLSCFGQTEDILSLIDNFEHTPLHKFALLSTNLTTAKAASRTDKTNIDITDTNPVDGTSAAGILGTIDKNTSPELIIVKPQLSVELKFVAYSSPIGTADGTNKKPAFMFSQFGADSIARMFEPEGVQGINLLGDMVGSNY